MRSVQQGDYGYIVNFWADGDFHFTGDALSGRTFKAMTQAAGSDQAIEDRVDLLRFRVKEEFYNFRNDPDALDNLIDDPDLLNEKQRLKKLLYAEMKRSGDPLSDVFANEFMEMDGKQ